MNQKVFIFTKTKWSEVPRMRHDFTKLMLEMGYEIIFFEKPTFLKTSSNKIISIDEQLHLIQIGELLHHQLRFFPSANFFNAWYQKRQLRLYPSPDLIINFNYDYDWLRDVYPQKTIITIINDAFELTARFWMRSTAQRLLKQTIEKSDACLAVSIPILKRCKKFNHHSYLFLPWAETSQISYPQIELIPQKLVYWGYINERINWDVLEFLALQGIKIDCIGPLNLKKRNWSFFQHAANSNTMSVKVKRKLELKGIRFLPPLAFEELKKIRSKYFAAIIPFRNNDHIIQSITLSNKTCKLLSLGLPIISCFLPDSLKSSSSIIRQCNTLNDYYRAAIELKNYPPMISTIENFLKNHTQLKRQKLLLKILNQVEHRVTIQ